MMTEPFPTFLGMRTHHVVIALIAILIAVALGVELLSSGETRSCRANASICSTPRCATARRPTASTSRWTTSSRSRRMLDELGIDYVEGGYPGANPTDTEFLRREAAAARDASPPSA